MSWLRGLFGRRAAVAPPRVPDGLRIYAIGDVHGCLPQLLALEETVRSRAARNPAARTLLIYLGDYVDRGPDSAGVLAHLAAPPADGLERRILMGNHEELMLATLGDAALWESWRMLGAAETLASYGLDAARLLARGPQAVAALEQALPDSHRALLGRMERLLVVGGYAFVHGGLRPGVTLDRQARHDLLWIREEFLEFDGDFGAFVVHGHTPVPEPDERPNRLNLDTGAYLTGRLSAVELEADRREIFQ